MKRRNVDSSTRMRRPLKRNKISDGLCGNGLIYLKLLLVWASVIIADFLLEVRFEYLWMFWLLLRSVYDSFRYQGTAFSVFFVCITVTSDMICYVFIPVQWLFFLASTYVWVQYVWHADRGICVPTVSLWLLFIYVEASIRLRELRSVPFTMDLCRPFAAHCIGYPMITLGFGVKSYVSYRLRLRKQREVARINAQYVQLLSEALPAEQLCNGDADKQKYLTNQPSEDVISNGAICNANSSSPRSSSYIQSDASSRSASKGFNSPSMIPKKSINFDNYSSSTSPIENRHNSSDGIYDGLEDDVATEADQDVGWDSYSILDVIKAKLFGASNVPNSLDTPNGNAASLCSSPTWNASSLNDSDEESRASKDSRDSGNVIPPAATATTKRQGVGGGKQKSKRRYLNAYSMNQQQQPPSENLFAQQDRNTPQPLSEQKEKVQDKDLYLSLESDIDKLKVELRASRVREQELRGQIQDFTVSDKNVKNELEQLRQNNEQLQTRIQNLVRSRQQDKQNMATIEKKLADEQKMRSQSEQQLQQERKQRKAEDAARTSVSSAKTDCAEMCKQRRRELDQQLKQVRRDLQQREEQVTLLENEIRSLRAFKEQNNVDILMSALSVMQEKNAHLESALSAETRIKLDLFSALGEARRQLELVQSKLVKTQQDADEMRRQLNNETSVSGSMYSNGGPNSNLVTVSSAMSPQSRDASHMDLLGSAAYHTASYMSGLRGMMFNETAMTPGEYEALPLMAMGNIPVSDGTMQHYPHANIH